jgi:hypothetical protein
LKMWIFFEETTAFQTLLPLSGTCFRVVYVLVNFWGKSRSFYCFQKVRMVRPLQSPQIDGFSFWKCEFFWRNDCFPNAAPTLRDVF